VDDICDGGGTFLGISDELDKLRPSYKELVITHGLFTKGMDQLNLAYDCIWTLDVYAHRGGTRHVQIDAFGIFGAMERR
jgi:ribose-phosphate pyrophosphokinase